jgi:hypothetical protein
MKQNGMHVGILTAVLALVGPAVPASAQTPAREVVPLEFVEALSQFPFGPGVTPEVLVGRIPEATASVLSLPADSRIVGSLVYPSLTLSAIAVSGTPGAVRDTWVERLLDTGWTRYEQRPRGGFESNPAEGLQFCMGDSVMVNLGVSETPRGGSYLIIMHPTDHRYSICQSRERANMRVQESPIPSLAPPSGSVSLGGGSGGGSDSWDSRARIRTDLTVDALVDHYGSQLREHGWKLQERTSGPGIVAEVFQVTDPEGTAWHGVLVASTPSAESDRFLSLRLTRVERVF